MDSSLYLEIYQCIHPSIRSTMEYGVTVWDSYKQQDIQSLKKIQWQAAR